MIVDNKEGGQLVHPSQSQRQDQIIANRQTFGWRRRHLTFFRKGDPETLRRAALPDLYPQVSADLRGRYTRYLPRYDVEGVIFSPRWEEVDNIPEGSIILGVSQSWRDYSKNPPKTKTFNELSFPKISGGVDVALRMAEKIRDKYRIVGNGENHEALQVLATLDYLSTLRQQAMRMPEFTPDDLKEIVEKNANFLAENRLLNPKSAEKTRIRDLMLRGFTSANGQKNYLTAYSRIAAIELAARKILECSFPPTLIKYTASAEVLRFERDVTRRYLAGIIVTLAQPNSIDYLRGISLQLAQRIRVRPYLTFARESIINFGLIDLPGGTEAAKLQQERRTLGIPTVADYLKTGDLPGAKQLVEQTRNTLQQNLAFYADYQTVNLSKRS